MSWCAQDVHTPEEEHTRPAGGRIHDLVLLVRSWWGRESDWTDFLKLLRGKSYKGNSCRVLQLNSSTAKCFIHLPLLFGGRRTSPEAPAIILLVAFQWQYSQLPEALINKMKIHTAKLEHTTINNIFLFAGQVNSFCKELLCWLLSSQKRISCFSSISEVISALFLRQTQLNLLMQCIALSSSEYSQEEGISSYLFLCVSWCFL